MRTLMYIVMDDVVEKKGVVTKADLKYLPTKEEFFERMDMLSGDLKKNGEAQDMITKRHKTHSDQIETLEKKVKKIERTLHLS